MSEDDAKQIGLDKMLDPCYSSLAGVVILLYYFNVIMRPINRITSHLIELKFLGTGIHVLPGLCIYLLHHHLSLKKTGLKWFFFFNSIILFELQLHEECMVPTIVQEPIFVLSADLDPLVTDFIVDGPRT